jgi:gliding motility-associated-like protein
MWPYRNLLVLVLLFTYSFAHGQQQDLDLHLNSEFLNGKTILKVKRDFYDPYLWVLAKNNEVYRINSITKAVDNYTTQFTAFNTSPFIDIAGYSQDNVFIATQTQIIIFNKGVISAKGIADGILGNINSIGISYKYDSFTNNVLRIGTDLGLCNYDFQKDQLTPYPDSQYARVFEATYRREMYSDYGLSSFIPSYTYPVLCFDYNTLGAYLLKQGEYGDNISTAFYSTGTLYPNIWGETFNLWWATEKGLFQIDDAEGFGKGMYDHYLDDIKINKITDIYGLTSFGNTYTKENLLVGTAQGLYFSNSLYQSIPYNGLDNISLFHYDALGNVAINDICVNAASIQNPICEDGVWLATDNGLYLIKPDYAAFNNSQKINALHFENETSDQVQANVCAGSSINIDVNQDVSSQNIQWYKDGNELPSAIQRQISLNQSGDYYAVIYDPCGDIHLETNHLKVTIIQPPVFTFDYPDKLVYCDGTPVTLTVQGSTAYQYRWYTDGTLNGDITAGANITKSGKYKVEVSSCDGTWVPSKEVQVDIIKIPTPTLQADKPAYCMGDNATLTTGIATDPSYTINWYKDNILLTANSNRTSLVVNENGSYSVTVTSNEVNTDGTTCTQTAVGQNIVFNPPPTVSIQKIVTTTLCDGQTIDLKVSYNTGTVQWSTGQSSDLITVSASGTYSATVTSSAGCTTSSGINVQFFPNPTLNLPNYGVCVPSKKTATLTAPTGMASYTWNGKSGTNTYIVDHPETVTLTITDANGCQATQDVQVVDECPNISIPNAFTPNGDGINDTWDIVGLEYDPTSTVKIFTRDGQQIFDSKGYPKPWDGQYKGKQLPSGVYYYIIKVKNNSQTYSGPVTIIY